MNVRTQSVPLKLDRLNRSSFKRTCLILATLVGIALPALGADQVVVGSKKFTESYVLAEIAKRVLIENGIPAEHRQGMGGTIILWQALRGGQIDLYPEYTGTAFTAILRHPPISSPQSVYSQVKSEYETQFNLWVSPPLGFDNTFAILVRGEDARRLNLRTISDAIRYSSQWRAGFGHDFMVRPDGYDGFTRAYGLRFAGVSDMALDLTYTALASRQVDMIAGNSTDGRIAALDLFQLEDDQHYFPPYQGVFIARKDQLMGPEGDFAGRRVNILRSILESLSGAISTDEMRKLNYEVDGAKRDKKIVVHEWLIKKGFVTGQ